VRGREKKTPILLLVFSLLSRENSLSLSLSLLCFPVLFSPPPSPPSLPLLSTPASENLSEDEDTSEILEIFGNLTLLGKLCIFFFSLFFRILLSSSSI